MTDNAAVLAGFTREVVGNNGTYSFYLLIKPYTDLDGSFYAWDTDEREFIQVHGWLWSFVDGHADD